jgi:hypothetical protein
VQQEQEEPEEQGSVVTEVLLLPEVPEVLAVR